MIIPLNTDAPVYHWPVVTVLVIVVNCVLHAVVPLEPLEENPLLLEFGHGLHPHEWVASAFLHFDVGHLIGNMIFLWVFGLVVEGKLGWWRFASVYLGIAVVHGFVEQLLMLGHSGLPIGSGGASGVVYGLMAMSFVWAPRNEVTCIIPIPFVWYFSRKFVFEVSIQWLCGFFVVMQILYWWTVSDFGMSSEFAHLLGAALGGGLAVFMLKKGWVDCENWDIFAVTSKTHGTLAAYEPYRYRDAPTADPTPEFADEPDEAESPARKSLRRLRRRIERGESAAALTEYESWQRTALGKRIPDEVLVDLVRLLVADRLDEDVEWIVEDYFEGPRKSAVVVLRLAEAVASSGRSHAVLDELLDRLERSRSKLPEAGVERLDELTGRRRSARSGGRTRQKGGNARTKPREETSSSERRQITVEADEEWPFD